jgi:hypothetical protein
MKLSIEISQEEVAEIALMAIGIVDKLNPPAPDYVGSAAAAGTPRAPTPHPHAPFGWMQDRTTGEWRPRKRAAFNARNDGGD